MRTAQRRRRGGATVATAAWLSRASDRGDQPTHCLDAPDTVVFGIDEHDIVLAIDGDLFWAIEGGLQRRPMVTSVALCPGPGDGANDARLHVHLTHLVVISQTDIEVPCRPKCQGARPEQCGAIGRAAVAAGACFSGASERGNNPRGQIHDAHAMVTHVGDEGASLAIQHDVVRLLQLCLARRAFVAAIPGLTGAGDGANDTCRGLDHANAGVEAIDNIQIISRVNGDAVG
jgi:hypothetical protein